MKTVAFILLSVLLMSSTPVSVAKDVSKARTSIVVHVYFQLSTPPLAPVCIAPLWLPKVYTSAGVYSVPCPSSTVTVDLIEGDWLYFRSQIFTKFTWVTGPAHYVTADDITIGSIDLVTPYPY
jgi:hypothetical protein